MTLKIKLFIYLLCCTCLIDECNTFKLEQNITSANYYSCSIKEAKKISKNYNSKLICVQGSKIELDSNFTYTKETCANIVKGNWKQIKDTLYLYQNSLRFKIDKYNYDTNYNKYLNKSYTEKYKIINNYIFNYFYNTDNEKIIDALKLKN